MSNSVIAIENLSKKYTISHQQREEYSSLRDALTVSVTNFGKGLIRPFRSSLESQPSSLVPCSEDFWALKDISFEVKQGDRIGIIGRNGAGKSTLLKILSRITEPTTGSIKIKGRVASLLEVGTGFHPELTGRENIFLNGAILGMGRLEIRNKFDEIVYFSEIEKFLDTPVKRYSSGMYVRLAFAVAAHLEPEILIVDEVLAVGDAQFQKKCLGKMESVGKEGRTVLFVSHNVAAIRNLCNKGIFLSSGKLALKSEMKDVINEYVNSLEPAKLCDGQPLAYNEARGIKLIGIDVVDDNHDKISSLQAGTAGTIRFIIDSATEQKNILISVTLSTLDDLRICVLHSKISGSSSINLHENTNTIACRIKKVPFVPGVYRLSVKAVSASGETIFNAPHITQIVVENGDFFGTGRLPDSSWSGMLLVENNWNTVNS